MSFFSAPTHVRLCIVIALACLFGSHSSMAVRGRTTPLASAPQRLKTGVVEILKLDREGKLTTRCTGSILADHTVLTAAHCFDDQDYNVVVSYQQYDYPAIAVHMSDRYKRTNIYHPHYGHLYDLKVESDFALIETQVSLPVDDAVALASDSMSITSDTELFVSGYGQFANIYGIGEGAGVLRISEPMFPKDIGPERMRVESGGTGACHGDSGGPLWAQSPTGSWVQVAVVSQGDCNTYSMYERVSRKSLDAASYISYDVEW